MAKASPNLTAFGDFGLRSILTALSIRNSVSKESGVQHDDFIVITEIEFLNSGVGGSLHDLAPKKDALFKVRQHKRPCCQ